MARRYDDENLLEEVSRMLGGFMTRLLLVLGALVFAFVLFFLVLDLDAFFGYFWQPVRAEEVGIKFEQNRPYEVVGPGLYTELAPFQFRSLKTIRIEGLAFQAQDEEVLTKDQQRIGVLVSGTVHRPNFEKASVLLANWANYWHLYANDRALFYQDEKSKQPGGLMQDLGRQAMKVCVGGLKFDDAVIGAGRDNLRECIDKELDRLAQGYGLEVRNIVVPNVVLAQDVQKRLDEITQSRLATQLADQQKLQAESEAKRVLATEAGKILVEQGRVQEKARQDKTTAELEEQAQKAQKQVIEARKSNELLASQKDLEIARITREVAEERAKAELASEITKAAMFQGSPQYADIVKVQAIANAYKATDKVMVLPNNSNPMVFMGQAPNIAVPAPQGGR